MQYSSSKKTTKLNKLKNYAGMAPAALPAPLGSKDFYEKVNPYWLDQGARLKHQATSRKRQATSNKPQATSLTKIK